MIAPSSDTAPNWRCGFLVTHCLSFPTHPKVPSGEIHSRAFARRSLAYVSGVRLACRRHCHVQRCSAGVVAQHSVGGVSRGALAGVDGDGISVGDVLVQVVAAEGGACAVAQAAGGDPVVFGVDRDDPPAVAVAHRIVGRKILSLDAVADIAGAFTYRDVDGLACRRHHHPPVVVRGDVANDNRKSRCRLDHSSDVSSMQRWSQARRRSVLRRAATTRRASRNCSQITSGSSSASMSIALSASASYWRCRRASR